MDSIFTVGHFIYDSRILAKHDFIVLLSRGGIWPIRRFEPVRKMNTFAIVLTLCIWCMACLAGCGKEEEPQRFDLQVEQEPFYDVAANEDVYTHFLSMQVYRDEYGCVLV